MQANVIDNQGCRLADILNQLLAGHSGKTLEVAAFLELAATGCSRSLDGIG
jgi:hypothetical protein